MNVPGQFQQPRNKSWQCDGTARKGFWVKTSGLCTETETTTGIIKSVKSMRMPALAWHVHRHQQEHQDYIKF